jgi:hypothetical protein
VSWGNARNAYGVPDLSEPVLHEAEPGPGSVHDSGPLRKDGKLLAASQPGLVPAHNLFTYAVRYVRTQIRIRIHEHTI